MAEEMTSPSFSANYPRFSPEVSGELIRISTALGTIKGARVLPAVADQLRANARIGTVHYSNLIEGNELPVLEAERAAQGQLEPGSRAKIELINYVAALDLVDERLDAGELRPTEEFLKKLHGTTTAGLGRADDPHFKPHHEGEWRDGIAIVRDQLTGKTMHEGPPPGEVPARMAALFDWLERRREAGREPIFVLAGVAHYAVTDVHPFADGNGRVARLLQVALLMDAGVLPGRMFSFERFYAEDRGAYYAALRSVRERTLSMEHWLRYFLAGLAAEYERVASTVIDLGSMTGLSGDDALQLTAGQERALTALRIEGRSEFSRQDYERAALIGRTTAGGDLRTLVHHGILVPRGSGSATRYSFSGAGRGPGIRRDGRGRPAKWTESRIERELRDFVGGRAAWPSPKDFAAAGKGDLYAAASRNGGIGRWRRAVGL
jgi:Fic family protein